MKIKPFKLERFFAEYEFTAPYLLCCSDCEALTLKQLLSMADPQALAMFNDLSLGYTESAGLPALRREISELYQNTGPDNILETVPEEGIFIAMNTLLKPGDHVIVTFPGYQSLYSIAEAVGCSVTRWLPRKKDLPGLLWEFNIQDLSNLIRPETSLIIINFPHNPTGASISDQDLLQIVGFCRQLDIPLFSDEMYRMLESDKAERLPFVSDIYEKGIGLFGMSKTFSLPGLRTGWLASENIDFLEKARAFKDYTTICSSGPSEILALIGLRARDKIIKTNLDLIKKNLDILDDFFSEYDNLFEWARPGAGPVGLVGFRPENSGFVNADHFCSDLISKAGVLLAPAGCFDYEENAFRIGFARKNMPDCLRQLEIFLKTNKKHLKTN